LTSNSTATTATATNVGGPAVMIIFLFRLTKLFGIYSVI
jgi:hypothetical protein